MSFVLSQKCFEVLLGKRWGAGSLRFSGQSTSALDMWSLEASLTQMGFQSHSWFEDVSLTR